MTAGAAFQDGFSGRSVCVTGGAGFIGSHLCDALVEAGATVRVIDDLSNGKAENLKQVADRIELIESSILDAAALRAAMTETDVVFHLAALGSVPASIEQPAMYHEVNATGTLFVLEAARQLGVRRVVFSASSSAYGNSDVLPVPETLAPEPMSPYAASKCAGEHLMRAYACCYELSTISLRYFNIFGPRQRPDSQYAAVIPRFAAAMQGGDKPTVFGDGEQTRDFTHVDNAVRANLLAAVSDKDLVGEAVNIACGERFSLLELIDTMAGLIGVEPQWEHAPPRAGEVRHSQASIDAARELIGYEPVVDFEAGLRQTLDAFGTAVDAKS